MALVLVVDDVKSERELMARVVLECGHTPHHAVDGLDAIEKARAAKPCLILMDVVMPNLNGFNAVRRLKGDPETASIPVVLVTHRGADSDLTWARKLGAADHVVKPFTAERLARVVRQHLPVS